MTKLADALVPVKDAAIRKRQVTIEVLTIDTRQVTQSLYRQMVEENIVDPETGELQGEVWGWVNLHDKDCPERSHLHAIWERDGKLRRTCTRLSSDNSYSKSLLSRLHELSSLYLCFVALAGQEFSHWHEGLSYLDITVRGISVNTSIEYGVKTIWEAPIQIRRYEERIEKLQAVDCLTAREKEERIRDWQRLIESFKKEAESLKKEGIKGILDVRRKIYGKEDRYGYLNPTQYTSSKQVWADMASIADKINLREQRWKESYKAIKDAGQLFIAVSGVWK